MGKRGATARSRGARGSSVDVCNYCSHGYTRRLYDATMYPDLEGGPRTLRMDRVADVHRR
jgi:hypothetical protein